MKTKLTAVLMIVLLGTTTAGSVDPIPKDEQWAAAILAEPLKTWGANETGVPEEVQKILDDVVEWLDGAICLNGYDWQSLRGNSSALLDFGGSNGLITHVSFGRQGGDPSAKDPWVKTLQAHSVSTELPCSVGAPPDQPAPMATMRIKPAGQGGASTCGDTRSRYIHCEGDWERWASYQ